MTDLINQTNVNKGTADPLIETPTPFDITNKLGNNLDEGTTNDYIFDAVKSRTAIDEIIQREGTPVEVGGSFQFHFMRFKSKYDHATGNFLDVVQLQVFQQGFMENQSSQFTNIPQVTLIKPLLESGDRANVLELDSSLEVEKGTNLIAIGNKASGTYPKDYSMQVGAETVFNNAQIWEDGREYIAGILVKFNNLTYECILDHTAQTSNDPINGLGTTWVGGLVFDFKSAWTTATGYSVTQLVSHNLIGYKALQSHTSSSANEPPNDQFWVREAWIPTTEYSPLTKDKAQYWINALGGAKHAETNNAQAAMIDPSVIVLDKYHPRTWVDCVAHTSTNVYNKSDLMQGSLPFDGFRSLAVNPTDGDGSFAQFDGQTSDPNGVAYAGNIVEYRDPSLDQTGTWFVFKDSQQDDFEVYDFEEGDSWTNNPCSSAFDYVNSVGECKTIIGGAAGTRDTVWVKGAYVLAPDFLPPFELRGKWQADELFTCVHSVKWDSGNSRIDCGNEEIEGFVNSNNPPLHSSTSAIFIKSEPTDTSRHFPHFVGLNFSFPWPRTGNGSPFGSVTIGEKIDLPSFDLDNMHLTHVRDREWYGPNVEDFFPIQDFQFWQFFVEQVQIDKFRGLNAPKTAGDYSFSLWLCDRSDVTIQIDYIHSHNNGTFPQAAPLTIQKIYRAVPGLSTFIPAQQPEILEVFDFRNVVRGGIYTKDSFDEQNRYKTLHRSPFWLSNELKLSIDGFRMSKPLVCTNADEPDDKNERNLEPVKFLYEKITNYAQLKNYILAQEAISGFRTDRYTIQTAGRCNIAFGDPVFYEDPEAIDETFDPSGLNLANTVRATAHSIVYSLSKGADGPGGFTRTVNLVTRIYPDETP